MARRDTSTSKEIAAELVRRYGKRHAIEVAMWNCRHASSDAAASHWSGVLSQIR